MPEPIDAPLLPPMSPEAARVYKLMKPGLRYTYQEIAATLDITEQAAQMRLARMAARRHIVRLGAKRYYRYALPQQVALSSMDERNVFSLQRAMVGHP